MDFSNLTPLSNLLIRAVCNTLVQSLGQGAVLAVITWLIIVFTRSSSSARRYNFLTITLALFALSTTGTFILELNPAFRVQRGINLANSISCLTSLINWGNTHFNKNLIVIFFLWILIVCIRIAQLVIGLQQISYFRSKSAFPVTEFWENRINQLALQLGISKLISIAESGIVKVPMVIGHFKPLIIIPIGLLTALKAEEIEAILLHELAHIYRKDYLINLMQNIMEIIFFFNPALLWLSSLIRLERENCCDDIAIAQSSSKKNYIQALVSCGEYQYAFPYAMALYDNKNHLKTRVNRILTGSNRSILTKEALCIVTSFMITLLITMILNNQLTPVFPSPKLAMATADHAEVVNETTVYNKQTQSIETTANYSKDELKIDDFISELIKNKRIEKKYKSFSFTLSDKEFILNGEKQPEVIFEKVKRKYIVASHKHWSWQWDNFSPEDLRQLQQNTMVTPLKGEVMPNIPILQITTNS